MGKICPKCKSEGEFYKDVSRKDGFTTYCKSCQHKRYEKISKLPETIARNRRNNLKWNKVNKKWKTAYEAERTRRMKQRCIQHYGGECACCQENRYEFLSLDHKNGGGNQHRKTITIKIERWLIKNNFPDGFQVLCHNCNMSIGLYGYCPHQTE
jgi:hypothetical protein